MTERIRRPLTRWRKTAFPELLTALLLFLGSAFAQASQPNIILLFVDDMGYSDLGCFGGEIDTPHVDSLANAGLRFTNFRVTPMCVTSRVSLLSGMEYHAAGRGNLPNGLSFAYLLRDAGYHTSLSGKVHGYNLLLSDPTRDYGFDRFFGRLDGAWDCFTGPTGYTLDTTPLIGQDPDFYATDAITDYTISFIDDALAQGKPFFSWVCFNAPHTPLHAPEADVRKYLDTGVYDAGWDVLRDARIARQKQLGIIPADLTTARTGVEIPDWNLLPQTASDDWLMRRDFEAKTMSAYAGMIDRIDQNIGRLLAHLQDPDGNGNSSDSILDNTLILFCSDNGGGYAELWRDPATLPWSAGQEVRCNYGWSIVKNAPFRYYKHSSHEGGIRSGLVAHWPDGITLPDGTILHQNTNLWDIYPTLIELAGASYPSGGYTFPGTSTTRNPKPLMGESLVPLFTDASSSAGSDRFISSYERSRGLIDGDWKIVTYDDSPWELYRIADDPTERTDLAGTYPDTLGQMVADWDAHFTTHAIPASWNPVPGAQHRGFGFDFIRDGLVSTVPAYMSAGVPTDVKLTLNTSGTIDFNGTNGLEIRLTKYGSTSVLWSADPDAFHPAQGTTSITFTDFPTLEPDTHYSITWDSGWMKSDGSSLGPVRDYAFAFRFKTASSYASSIVRGAVLPQDDEIADGQPDLIGYALADDDAEPRFDFRFEGDTTPPTPVLRFRAKKNAADATLVIEHSEQLTDFTSIFEIEGDNHIITDPVVQTVHTRDYDDITDYTLRLDPGLANLGREFFRAAGTLNPGAGSNGPLAMWTFRDGNLPDKLSPLATPQSASFGGANSGILTNVGSFTLDDPTACWSGDQLPPSALSTQLQTAIVADQPLQVTRIQYTGWLWSDRASTTNTSIVADVVAWLNGSLDTPGVVSPAQTIITGNGGTSLQRFSVLFPITGKLLDVGDTWELRLRLRDGNSDAYTLSEEGFGIDTVVLYGDYLDPVSPIATYDFTGGSNSSTDTEASTTAGSYTMAYYNSASPGTAEFTTTVNGLSLGSGTATSSFDRETDPTLTDALNTIDFPENTLLHRFDVTIPAGVTVDLSSIDFDWGVAETNFFNGLNPELTLVCDKTGSTALLNTSFSIPAGVVADLYNPDGSGNLKSYSTDLTGQSALQGLTNTTVTFILGLDENLNKDDTRRRHVIDNVSLNGTVTP